MCPRETCEKRGKGRGLRTAMCDTCVLINYSCVDYRSKRIRLISRTDPSVFVDTVTFVRFFFFFFLVDLHIDAASARAIKLEIDDRLTRNYYTVINIQSCTYPGIDKRIELFVIKYKTHFFLSIISLIIAPLDILTVKPEIKKGNSVCI